MSDFDRPLESRGREAAELIGRFLASETPDLPIAISSPALRARETTEIVLKSAARRVEPRYDERIYEADLRRLLEVLTGIDDETKAVLLVGHNPGMEELFAFLNGEGRHLKTAALAKMNIAVSSWRGIREGEARLEWLATPDELPDL